MSRRTCRALAGLAGSLLLLGGLASAPAQAGWGASQLVSVDNARLEQADGATNTIDMSGDGRWVVFQTRAGNFFADDDFDAPGTTRQGGVFRFDRQTGAIQLVADGDLLDEESGTLLRRGAVRPSVSDDGRTVVFATGQQLVPQDTNDNVDVYVRDMDVPVGADRAASGAYTLVSARDGGDTPAQYAPLDTPLVGGSPGSDVFAGQAISGDGRYVAFRTADLASDLPSRDAVDTPPFNVFVRDLAQKRTVLVSPASDGSGGAGGAQSPVVLSRDGSTVSWVGQHAADQTRFLPGENSDSSLMYYLWRRWDDPDATTRRVTGQVDPDDPACDSGRVDPSPVAIGPCYGPLADFDAGFNDIGSRAPALSADGWTVAFLSGAAPRPAQDPDSYLDAYVTSMRPGVAQGRYASDHTWHDGPESGCQRRDPVGRDAGGRQPAAAGDRSSAVLAARTAAGRRAALRGRWRGAVHGRPRVRRRHATCAATRGRRAGGGSRPESRPVRRRSHDRVHLRRAQPDRRRRQRASRCLCRDGNAGCGQRAATGRARQRRDR